MDLIHKDESYELIGAFYEVHNELGHGFLEEVYQQSLKHEFGLRRIPFVEKPKLEIRYKGELLQKGYEQDFVCYSKIIVELKAVKSLDDSHRSQVFNYLKATTFQLGFLVNFGSSEELEYHRIVHTQK